MSKLNGKIKILDDKHKVKFIVAVKADSGMKSEHCEVTLYNRNDKESFFKIFSDLIWIKYDWNSYPLIHRTCSLRVCWEWTTRRHHLLVNYSVFRIIRLANVHTFQNAELRAMRCSRKSLVKAIARQCLQGRLLWAKICGHL